MRTDYRECQFCHVRIIFPVDGHGKKLPPVEYSPDPVGTMAVRHEVTGEYRGRFLARGERVDAPDERHALHHCEGSERQRQRGNWTSAVNARKADRRRGRHRTHTEPPGVLPGMTRLNPGRTPDDH